ncbi:cytochrome c family protein [Thiolapillus sp.]
MAATLQKTPNSQHPAKETTAPVVVAETRAGITAVDGQFVLEPLKEKEEIRFDARPKYVGIENCKLCHLPHFESWAETKMSKAFELLKPGIRAEAKRKAGLDPQQDFTKDPQCLRCHVTGYGKPGGFVSMEQTPDMANVQCEMCHGPGSIYSEMMLKKQGTYTLEEYRTKGGLTMPSPKNNVCTDQCHNPESPFTGSGYQFDFEDRKAMGTHKHDLNYIYLPFHL